MLRCKKPLLKYYLISIVILIGIAIVFSYIATLILKQLVIVDSSNSYIFNAPIQSYFGISILLCLLTVIFYSIIEMISSFKWLILQCLVSALIMSLVIIIFAGSTWGISFNPYLIKTLVSYGLSAAIFPIILSIITQKNRNI